MAEANLDFVAGLVCQQKLSDKPDLLHMTPGTLAVMLCQVKSSSSWDDKMFITGVHLAVGEDALGQRYRTPEQVFS